MKTLLRFFCFSLFFIITACALKVAPPPVFIEEELSLQEIIQKAGEGIEVLKAIADITIERNGEPYDFVNASVLIKKPGQVHMRIYKFGMLVKDFVIKDKTLYMLSGKSSDNLKKLGDEFYSSIFWWDNMEDGAVYSEGGEYVLTALNKKIYIDKATLIPVKQDIIAFGKPINIRYSEPKNEQENFWYPSLIEIYLGDFKFSVKLKKLLKNPELGEFDFQTLSTT